ncbi:MAG: hypothetical protein WC858_01030 [Parcubacteria group bacterium]|jgi:hypothetical protein
MLSNIKPKNKGITKYLRSFAWSVFFIAALVLFGYSCQAAKKTKWQNILEQNGVPQTYWEKYLPKISRTEYNKIKKNYQAAVASQNNNTNSGNSPSSTSDVVNVVSGKYPLPDTVGKIAIEQHLWLKKNQSASSHYSMANVSKSCQNGMAGGYGSFGPLDSGDKNEEKYYVTMRWEYTDWKEPESELASKIDKVAKSITLKDADDFPKSGYVKIEGEYMHYSSKSGDKLKGLSRGYKSSKAAHDKNDAVRLEYRYKGGQWERVTRALDSSTSKKDWYKKKKVLVTNKRNGKKVVASILEAGPAIWTGRVGGLSPEAFEAISAKNNENCEFQYVDDDTKLGSVK